MGVSGLPRNSGAARIGTLATLPVFLDLKGKPVLVAGDSDGAAWKAELLAACGAEVHLFARLDHAPDSVRDFAARADVVHHDCGWEAADFRHFVLAIGDCAPEEGRAFHDRARAAGVPVNVIDQPEYCQFKFGSIVNRSPLVIGISTDGAAPILAQAVRRKIEALLPRQLAIWAQLALTIRGRVGRLLGSSAARRSFWERFSDLAFDASADTGEAERLLAAGHVSDGLMPGRVTVVGAGPGDAELLTMRGMRALQAADMILHDRSVPNDVLELARREAGRLVLGRRSSGQANDDTIGCSIDLAKSGKRIVWLVAGNPARSVAARADSDRLRRGGVVVDVVPGVDSMADAATPRDIPRGGRPPSVHLVAGHYHRGGVPLLSMPAVD